MVERVVFLGSATELILRLATGASLQALLQNDGDATVGALAQGTPVHLYLPPDALRVLPDSPSAAPATSSAAASAAEEASLAS